MTYKPTYRSPLVPIHLLYLLSINFSAIPAMPLCNTGGGLHIPGLRMLILWMPSTSHKIAPGNCGGMHMHVLDLFYYDRGQGGKGWIKSLLANPIASPWREPWAILGIPAVHPKATRKIHPRGAKARWNPLSCGRRSILFHPRNCDVGNSTKITIHDYMISSNFGVETL